MSETASRALAGRQERKGFLEAIINKENGLTYQEAKGHFTKRFGVSHRTFGEYLQDLVDEQKIAMEPDPQTGLTLYWSVNGRPSKK